MRGSADVCCFAVITIIKHSTDGMCTLLASRVVLVICPQDEERVFSVDPCYTVHSKCPNVSSVIVETTGDYTVR